MIPAPPPEDVDSSQGSSPCRLLQGATSSLPEPAFVHKIIAHPWNIGERLLLQSLAFPARAELEGRGIRKPGAVGGRGLRQGKGFWALNEPWAGRAALEVFWPWVGVQNSEAPFAQLLPGIRNFAKLLILHAQRFCGAHSIISSLSI